MSAEFFDFAGRLPRQPVTVGGSMGPAIVGTLLTTGVAALMAIPLGVLGAIYLNEYGKQSALARTIRTMADVMTGVPSIVMGLFIYIAVVLVTGDLNALRRRAGAGLPDAAGGHPQQRGDAPTGAGRAAPGEPGARRAQVAHHDVGGPAGVDLRHHQRRAARDRPSGGRDRADSFWSSAAHCGRTGARSRAATRRCPPRSTPTRPSRSRRRWTEPGVPR